MNRLRLLASSGLLVFTFVFATSLAYGQITPSADAYTNSAAPSTNYGAGVLLNVNGATQAAYIQFNLSAIPSSYTGAEIAQATLKLYVNTVPIAGSFNVDYVNGTWAENTITHNLAPALGTTIAPSVPITTASKNQFILIDVTPAVQAWLSGTTNDGIALVANGTFSATFDSKESTSTSHAPELDIVFAGTLSGVTTASSSGLTGGGTSGTLNLGLLTTCASGQVLQWTGTAWACATPKGAGTITGVTTASGSGLSGGGTSGTLALKVNSAVVPLLASANNFTAAQTVTGSNTTQILNVTQNGAGLAIVGTGGVSGSSTASAGSGVTGTSTGTAGYGVYGSDTATFGNGYGVYGTNNTEAGAGIEGYAANTTAGIGVEGESAGLYSIGVRGDSTGLYGVFGSASATSGATYGVYGTSASNSGAGVYGTGATGVVGVSSGPGSGSGNPGGNFAGYSALSGSNVDGTSGVEAYGGNGDPSLTDASEAGAGITAVGGSGTSGSAAGGGGVGGSFAGGNCTNCGSAEGIVAVAGGAGANVGDAAYFYGNVEIQGTLYGGSTEAVEMDDPQDPANKYLVHSSVESSEMKNIYDGTVTTDGQGHATVQLPEWFEVLNTDFRYQLTVIGQFAQAIVAHEIEDNRFEIGTSVPYVKVSWQVTGVRQDAYAKAHPLVVEQEKDARLRGFYIHPDLYGAPPERQIEWARHPQMMKRITEVQARQLAAAQKRALGVAPRPVAQPELPAAK
jgi:hypothetical protein